jgi:hypothetical protein
VQLALVSGIDINWLEKQTLEFLVVTLPLLIEDNLRSHFNLQAMAINYALTGDKKSIPFKNKPLQKPVPVNVDIAQNFMEQLMRSRNVSNT